MLSITPEHIRAPAPGGQTARTETTFPEDYAHVRDRLRRFYGVPKAASNQAWQWLLTWRSQILNSDRRILPAPFTFATEEGIVEMEWDVGGRHLWLTLAPASFEFYRSGPDGEKEGTLSIADVHAQLRWLLRA